MARDLPDIALSECPEDYARPVAQGFDTVQEAYALKQTPAFIKLLEDSQQAARDLQDDMEGTVEIDLFGEKFKAHATGAKGGFRWRLENDDYVLLIGSPKRDWTISARYLSAGLAEHGLTRLRERALQSLSLYTDKLNFSDWQRTSRVDYCFDFHSPAFTKEFEPGLARNVVCHSSAKTREQGGTYDLWGRGGHGETLTIGSKAGLQNQIYDKTLEINEASGKTWLHDVWLDAVQGEKIFGDDRPRDVWRLECRFSGDFLKDRNLRRPREVMAAIPELLTEALYMRRLALPSGDSNRSRWALHPIFSEAFRRRGAETIRPIGRKVTGRRAVLVERAEQSVGGSIASALALEHGSYDDADFEALSHQFIERARARVQADPNRARKKQAALSRYSREDEAR